MPCKTNKVKYNSWMIIDHFVKKIIKIDKILKILVSKSIFRKKKLLNNKFLFWF